MKAYKNVNFAVFLWLLALPAAAYANAEETLQNFLNAESFRANFNQTVYNAEGQKIDESKGFTLFHRPGRLRWEYVEPEPYLILSDGTDLLLYDIPLKQAYLRETVSALGTAPLMMLLEQRAMSDDFYVDSINADIYPDIDAVHWLRLVPKVDDTDFVYFDVGFKQDSLSYLVLYDHFDQHTRIQFYDVQSNPEFKRNYFLIQLPQDVDVIKGEP